MSIADHPSIDDHGEHAPSTELILYQTEDRGTRIDVRLDAGTVWLTQAQMAELFQTTPQNITLHLKSIFGEGELIEESTCKSYLQVRREGVACHEMPPSDWHTRSTIVSMSDVGSRRSAAEKRNLEDIEATMRGLPKRSRDPNV
jgi:hypothetical protein